MDERRYEAMARRIAALEARIVVLEEKLSAPQTQGGEADQIRSQFPIAMTKTDAAKLLGVTRATIYCMIRDGRLAENGWRKVTTKSVIDLMEKNAMTVRKTRGKGKEE